MKGQSVDSVFNLKKRAWVNHRKVFNAIQSLIYLVNKLIRWRYAVVITNQDIHRKARLKLSHALLNNRQHFLPNYLVCVEQVAKKQNLICTLLDLGCFTKNGLSVLNIVDLSVQVSDYLDFHPSDDTMTRACFGTIMNFLPSSS